MQFRHAEYYNTFDSCRARFSPDGKYAVAGSGNGSVHIWNIATGESHVVLKHKDGHKKDVCCVSWSPLGQARLPFTLTLTPALTPVTRVNQPSPLGQELLSWRKTMWPGARHGSTRAKKFLPTSFSPPP